jgi:hypothetical protein
MIGKKKESTRVYHSGNFDRPTCLPEALRIDISIMLSYFEVHHQKFDSHLRMARISDAMERRCP